MCGPRRRDSDYGLTVGCSQVAAETSAPCARGLAGARNTPPPPPPPAPRGRPADARPAAGRIPGFSAGRPCGPNQYPRRCRTAPAARPAPRARGAARRRRRRGVRALARPWRVRGPRRVGVSCAVRRCCRNLLRQDSKVWRSAWTEMYPPTKLGAEVACSVVQREISEFSDSFY